MSRPSDDPRDLPIPTLAHGAEAAGPAPGPAGGDPDPPERPEPEATPGPGAAIDDPLARCYADEYERLVGLARVLVDQRADAEEVVQEAFVRVYASRANLRDAARPLPYVRQAVVNVARGGLRRRLTERRHRDGELAGRPSDADPRLDTDHIVAGRRRDDELGKAISRLPRRQREVVALRYLVELSTAETADVMGCSNGAVKAYLHRAMARLRTDLEEA